MDTNSGKKLLSDVLSDIICVAQRLGLEDSMIRILTTCRRTPQFNLYVPRDSGDVDIVPGWRCHHRALGKTYRGGQLFHPYATQEMVEAKAMLMTMRVGREVLFKMQKPVQDSIVWTGFSFHPVTRKPRG